MTHLKNLKLTHDDVSKKLKMGKTTITKLLRVDSWEEATKSLLKNHPDLFKRNQIVALAKEPLPPRKVREKVAFKIVEEKGLEKETYKLLKELNPHTVGDLIHLHLSRPNTSTKALKKSLGVGELTLKRYETARKWSKQLRSYIEENQNFITGSDLCWASYRRDEKYAFNYIVEQVELRKKESKKNKKTLPQKRNDSISETPLLLEKEEENLSFKISLSKEVHEELQKQVDVAIEKYAMEAFIKKIKKGNLQIQSEN